MPDATKPVPRVSSTEAVEITLIDQRRFNEAISDGTYGCAPPTRKGARRFFDEANLVGMCVFERLMNCRMHKSEAGRIACDVVEHFQNAARDGDKVLVEVVFPSGLQYYHGIPIHTDLSGRAIKPDATEREFIGISVRVDSFLHAIRTRYANMIASGTSLSDDENVE